MISIFPWLYNEAYSCWILFWELLFMFLILVKLSAFIMVTECNWMPGWFCIMGKRRAVDLGWWYGHYHENASWCSCKVVFSCLSFFSEMLHRLFYRSSTWKRENYNTWTTGVPRKSSAKKAKKESIESWHNITLAFM